MTKFSLIRAALALPLTFGLAQGAAAQLGDFAVRPFALLGLEAGYVGGDTLGQGDVSAGLDMEMTIAGARIGFLLGVNAQRVWGYGAAPAPQDEEGYFLGLSNGQFHLTYGHIWGAGALAPDEVFNMTAASHHRHENVRLDYFGDVWRIALSKDLGSDDFEVGLSGAMGAMTLAAGYESADENLNLYLAQDLGRFDLASLANMDLDGDKSLGLHVGYDYSGALNIAGQLVYNVDQESLDMASLVARYALGPGTLTGRIDQDLAQDETQVTIGYQIPLGAFAPQAGDAFYLID